MNSDATHKIPDVLADRYASPEMVAIWSPNARVLLEREFWIAVMRAQQAVGVPIPDEAISAYERVKTLVDLTSIRRRESITRHDVKARIDEFCELAGYQHIHKGLTSRDLTENVEQLQIRRSLTLLKEKYVACLVSLSRRARELRDLPLTARTHNVPAQVTTVGRRLAMFGTEMLSAYRNLNDLLERYPLRGIKGPVGTEADLLMLFHGDRQKVQMLNEELRKHLEFEAQLGPVGQIYPRSLDSNMLSAVHQLTSGPANFARTLRLMAGAELAVEGFREGQVGSSAMPHKVNARSCERIDGFAVIVRGFLDMVLSLAGDQWNEGDVSCSVVRRVALPGAMFAADGLLNTLLVVTEEMKVFPEVIAAERRRYLPFLATTTILIAAVKKGAGREEAHEAIKGHAIAVAESLRNGQQTNDLLARLAGDDRLRLSIDELIHLMDATVEFCGSAMLQVDEFVIEVERVAARVAGASRFFPREIL